MFKHRKDQNLSMREVGEGIKYGSIEAAVIIARQIRKCEVALNRKEFLVLSEEKQEAGIAG